MTQFSYKSINGNPICNECGEIAHKQFVWGLCEKCSAKEEIHDKGERIFNK